MTGTEAILLSTTVIACVIAVIGFFSGHEKSSKEEVEKAAEWRGNVNGKLDTILGLTHRVEGLEETVHEHGAQISKLQDSSKRAHERLDAHIGGHADRCHTDR